MKKIAKKLFSLLMIIVILFYNFLTPVSMIKVYATTVMNEINIISSTTSVSPGVLPEFTASSNTEHVASIDEYGTNTQWSKWGQGFSSWSSFGAETPTAVDDGKTHYGLLIAVNLDSGYEFDENTTIYFNGSDVTNLGHTELSVMNWGGYIHIDLGTAGQELPMYTVSYDANGGTGSVLSQSVYAGDSVSLRINGFTAPEGLSFDDWLIGETKHAEASEFTPTGDTVVKATWTDKYIRNSRATMIPNSINENMKPNEIVFTSTEPAKYNLSLWRVFDLTDTNLNTDNGKFPENANFIEGHSYAIEVKFEAVDPYEYDEINSQRTSTFYLNDIALGISNAVAISGSVYRRVELTAAGANTHTVTFNSNGGTNLNSVNVVHGSVLPEPDPAPTKVNSTFAGWYTDEQLTTPYNFNSQVTSNFTLYAKWNQSAVSYTVSFDSNGGTPIQAQNVASGNTAAMPNPSPTKQGYTFAGWYIDDTLNTAFNFGTPITADITLYADWDFNRNDFTTIEIGGGTSITEADGDDNTVTVTYDNGIVIVSGNNLYSDTTVNQNNNFEVYTLGNVTITATPNQNYVADLMENGNLLGTATTNYNNLVAGNHKRIDGIFSEQAPQNSDIEFDITWNKSFVNTWINNINVMEESQEFDLQVYEYNNVVVQNAGTVDPNSTNVLRFQNRFGDLEVTEYTINNVQYDENSPEVEINDEGWFITVPGAEKYIISGTGNENIAVARTIIWANVDVDKTDENYNDDMLLEHGIASIKGIYRDGNQISGAVDANEETGMGWVPVTPGDTVVFEFIPEYGYQLTEVSANGIPLEAQDTMNEYSFVMPDANIHFSATFKKVNDKVSVNSSKISSGTISLGNNLEGGSAILTVNDVELDSDKVSGFKNAVGDYKISNYLDIDLYNVFYKGKNDTDDVWSNQIHELEHEATITIKLEEGINADDIVIVHNIHDGDEFEVINIDSYDSVTNTITFKTKSFSNYAIATKIGSTVKSPKTDDKVSTWFILLSISILGLLFNKNKLIFLKR